MIYYEDKRYKYWELFNENTGTLIRGNVEGKKEDPTMRSYPELIDVGIMGHCEAGKTGICKAVGVDCYQKGYICDKNNMLISDYERIMTESKGRVFQVALGGAGDPNKHESFTEVLQLARENHIVPNLTTSGFEISEEEIANIAKYCGAVAVSFYTTLKNGHETNETTITAISKLSKHLPTNIHYVISKDSVDEAVYRLENNIWPQGIEAIVFLLYKPFGFGKKEKLFISNSKLERFMIAALNKQHNYKIGFDTCFTPILMDYSQFFDNRSIDSCEAARFSMYIDSEMYAYPCSFDNQEGKYRVSIKNGTIEEAWTSDIFELFRDNSRRCVNCLNHKICNSGCGLNHFINMGANCQNLNL